MVTSTPKQQIFKSSYQGVLQILRKKCFADTDNRAGFKSVIFILHKAEGLWDVEAAKRQKQVIGSNGQSPEGQTPREIQ